MVGIRVGEFKQSDKMTILKYPTLFYVANTNGSPWSSVFHLKRILIKTLNNLRCRIGIPNAQYCMKLRWNQTNGLCLSQYVQWSKAQNSMNDEGEASESLWMWLTFQCLFAIVHLWIDASRFSLEITERKQYAMQQMLNGISLYCNNNHKATRSCFLKSQIGFLFYSILMWLLWSVLWMASETHFDDILFCDLDTKQKICSHEISHSLHDRIFLFCLCLKHDKNALNVLIFIFYSRIHSSNVTLTLIHEVNKQRQVNKKIVVFFSFWRWKVNKSLIFIVEQTYETWRHECILSFVFLLIY